jgi:hypothetical protein
MNSRRAPAPAFVAPSRLPGLLSLGLFLLVGFGGVLPPALIAQARSVERVGPSVARSTTPALGLGGAAPAAFPETPWARLDGDVRAMEQHRPGFSFWQHVFNIPDGSIVFGSAEDGRLLAVLPAQGDWNRAGRWVADDLPNALVDALRERRLEGRLTQRRDQLAELLQLRVGPVVHNPTRGEFVLPNARRYGGFVEEWGAIFERFGVPAELGLAQALVESGLNGRVRSEAGAIGFCQWLERNWNTMKRLSPHPIEGYNQTTQAAYCAAYLSILATKYGSFIPALSEHHAGGANVGRVVINGGRLGGQDVRERYLLGSELARDLRQISLPTYREVVRTYGPRSFRYAEMVFGNTPNVRTIRETQPQSRIYAMRASRAIPLSEVIQRTGLSADEVRRFNPALRNQVPRGAHLYLPTPVQAFGPDVSFWHRPADPAYVQVLEAFLDLNRDHEAWDLPEFQDLLRNFRRRFQETGSEEGTVMATVLGYVIQENATSGRGQILQEFRTNDNLLRLLERGVQERDRTRVTLGWAHP